MNTDYWNNKPFIGGAVFITLASTGSLSYYFYKAVHLKLAANKVYDCFCNFNFIANENCQQPLDLIYGGKGIRPYNVTLFCSTEGSLSTQQSTVNWNLGTNTFFLLISTISIIVVGVLLLKKYVCIKTDVINFQPLNESSIPLMGSEESINEDKSTI